MPDDNIIIAGNESFRCPEVLRELTLIGKEASGLQDTSFQSVKNDDVDRRKG